MGLKLQSATHLLLPLAQSHPSIRSDPQTCLGQANMPHFCLLHLDCTLLQVFMTADPETDEEDTRGGPRVAFLIMPAIFARPKPTPKWQYIFAAVLVALTLGSGLQLGLLANIARLPKVGVAKPFSHASSCRACLWSILRLCRP